MSVEKKETVGLTPFYHNPDSPGFSQEVSTLRETVGLLRGVTDAVVVVDDGTRITSVGDYLVNLPQNYGKAEALRQGLQEIFNHLPSTEYIVQVDYDRDQDPLETKTLLNYLRGQKIPGSSPAMVIGNRYTNAMSTLSEHRRGILLLQHAFCLALGYPNLTDITSGLRVYTIKFAREFVNKSRVSGFGVDAEQLIIARLIDAHVIGIPLHHSQERTTKTSIIKFLQSLDAMLMHATELQEKGFKGCVKFFKDLENKLARNQEMVELDLRPFGSDTRLRLNSDGDNYTIQILK